MTTGTDTNLIDLVKLCDQYIERAEDEWSQPGYPILWKFDVDGEPWLTDRYWLLPDRLCSTRGRHFPVQPLTDVMAERAAGWVRALRSTTEREPSDRVFAPTFAGVLTQAGLRAMKARIEGATDVALLVDERGAFVGGLMPLTQRREAEGKGTSLPVPAEVADLHRRIAATQLVAQWVAWDLAVALTSGGAA